MKKLIALLLAAILCLSLAACGSSPDASGNNDASQTESEETKTQLSKEELLTQAKEADANNINNECYENFIKAKNDYCNQTLQLKGIIKTFGDNYVELAGFYGAQYIIDVYMPVEEMLNLQAGQSIVVVGQTTDEIKEETENIAGFPWDTSHFQMPVAYLVKDTVEVEGILKGPNTSYVPAFNIEIGGSNYLKLIYFKENVDLNALEFGQKIKFSAKAINKNDSWEYRDAEIIE